jgi:PAS domain S-box-containing protein
MMKGKNGEKKKRVEPHGHSPGHPTSRPNGATSRPKVGAFIRGHSPRPSAAGVKITLTVTGQKATELKRIEAELAEARELLEKERKTLFPILHKAPYGIILIEKDGRFLYVNPEFTRITGYTVEDSYAERDWFHNASVFREYSRKIVKTWKEDVLEKGIEKVLPVTCKGGDIKHIEFKPTVLDDGRIIVMLSDVTERKHAEEELKKYRTHLEELVIERTAEVRATNEQLQQEIGERRRVQEEIVTLNQDLTRRAIELEAANKELEAFSYSVSHDLRTPLIGIYGLSQKLADKYADQLDPKGAQFLSIIQRDSQKMLQLIDNLLALSRFQHQEIQPLNIDMENLARVVYDELKAMSPEIPERSLQFKVKRLPPAYGDPAMIRQVFFNLLTNAVKFSRSRENAVIEIGFEPGDKGNTYYVRDNGVGFDMHHVDKLFGVFQRLHDSDQFEGTGIGLAIVQRIIHRQGGQVWAKGEIGKGATFYFTLPGDH